MPTLETYRKQAKQLVRWHRERNYSIGGKVRLLERFRDRTDAEILAAPLPLTLAQEVVAVEAGFPDWAALKAGAGPTKEPPTGDVAPVLQGVTPILFTPDVPATAAFYRDTLGFAVDFLHGNPPFYGAISRDGACLHLRHVDRPNFAELATREGSLILATIDVRNVKALYHELEGRGAPVAQPLTRQAWGGLDFHVRDPAGNVISFVEYRQGETARPDATPSTRSVGGAG